MSNNLEFSPYYYIITKRVKPRNRSCARILWKIWVWKTRHSSQTMAVAIGKSSVLFHAIKIILMQTGVYHYDAINFNLFKIC